MVGTAGADTDMPQAADAERSPAPRPLTSHHMADIIVVAGTTWVINDVRAALGEDRFTIHEITDPRAVVEAVREGTPTAVIVDFQVGSLGEAALASVPGERVEQLADNESRVRRRKALLEEPEAMLSSLLVANNFVNILAASVATILFVDLIGSPWGPGVA